MAALKTGLEERNQEEGRVFQLGAGKRKRSKIDTQIEHLVSQKKKKKGGKRGGKMSVGGPFGVATMPMQRGQGKKQNRKKRGKKKRKSGFLLH